METLSSLYSPKKDTRMKKAVFEITYNRYVNGSDVGLPIHIIGALDISKKELFTCEAKK